MKYNAKKQINSFKFALKGWKHTMGKEQNLNFHLMAMTLVIITALCLHVQYRDWCILILCIAMVISAEMFNSAIERLVDLVCPEFNIHAGKIKDIAAGAVLVCAVAAAVIGIIIFYPYLFH